LSSGGQKVGFIGLGQMGSRMAANLQKSGNQMTIFDTQPEAIKEAVGLGMKAVSTPREVAEASDVIVTMLPNSAIVTDVYQGENGVFAGCGDSAKLFVDSSTIDPMTCKSLAKHVSEKLPKCSMMDAPVSGGTGGAAAATLTFMCGGDPKTFEKLKPVLEQMGKNVLHAGDANGSGQVVKLCNNLVLGITMHGLSEGLKMGIEFGMDPEKMSQIMGTSSGGCWSLNAYNPMPGVMPNSVASGNYNGGFAIDLMIKDLGLALEAGKSVGVDQSLGENALGQYKALSASGHGKKDFGFCYQAKKIGSDLNKDTFQP